MADIVKLEVGCGHKRDHRADFVGLDRFPLPGVDVVCDLDNGRVPFADDTFDLIYASHSLEHVGDLMAVIRELWRVSKPGGQLCILAPYYSTSLNFANPYHHQNFNEHTPRFWTSAAHTRIDPREYEERFAWGNHWGKAQSDNSRTDVDFRCMRMEFFYFLPHARKRPSVRRRRRRMLNNVCHSLLYHLVAFKPPMSEADLDASTPAYYIPPEVEQIRAALQRPSVSGRMVRLARGAVRRVIASLSGSR